MIQLLENLPRNVIGIEATGKVTKADYKGTVIPRIEETQREFDKLSMVCVIDDAFEGFTPGAAWEDSKLAFKRPGSWERIAVVSDKESIKQALMLFGWMMPGDVKLFEPARVAEARSWASAA